MSFDGLEPARNRGSYRRWRGESPSPPTPSPQRWRMFLDYKLVPDDPENTNIIWITKNNFILGIFTLQNFILLS